MTFVVLLIVLVILIVGGVLIRRKSRKRGFSYVPDPSALGNKNYQPGEIPNVTVSTPEFETEEIAQDEFVSDVSDDLMDPRNPGHAEWVKNRPDVESDSEWEADHPGDSSS
ncbi:MAG TPA: hypothetical protein VMU68_12705 [Acidimicrobiales bacterium]|nr:hypothetical protein [Acidimicrobiales bacterium]